MTKEQLAEAIAEFHEIKAEIAERSGSTFRDVHSAIERECRRWTYDPTPIDLLAAARNLFSRLYGGKKPRERGERL